MKTSIVFRPSDNHYQCRLGIYKETVTKEQLQETLLNYSLPLAQGYLCKWKHEYLGVDIYEMWLEKDNSIYK